MMILRVWALYNQSMLVLNSFLTIYVMAEISYLISGVILIAQLQCKLK